MNPLLAVVAASLLTVTDELPVEPTPAPDTHFELSFGFMGGARDESRVGFIFAGGDAGSIPGASALSAPFATAPFSNLLVTGPSLEARWVQHHVRMTVGMQKPFAQFVLGQGVSGTDLQGVTREVSVRSFSFWDLRLGLGGEVTYRSVTPFADLCGDVQWVSSDVTIDGSAGSFKALMFGYSIRAGVRVAISDYLYVAPSAEFGLLGPQRYGAQLLVGFTFPVD
jgi:hypothetical protein